MSDQELDLIRRLKRRDQKALEEIIRLFNQYVAAIICRILYGLPDQSDIQALINHVFFLLWENADHIDTAKGDSLKSYLGAIARNTAQTERKKLIKPCPVKEDILGEISDDFNQVELRNIIFNALKKLNPEDQKLLLKFYFQGRSIQQIAGEWDMPVPTVKGRLQRSRTKLRKIMEEGGFIYED